MSGAPSTGQRIPPATLAELRGGEHVAVRTESLFQGRRAVVMGMPGAFSPTCARLHLPDFIANADRLRAAGYELLVCVCPNDPWVMSRWAEEVDPEGKIRFLSDGNLELTRKLGMVARAEHFHLGERSQRYSMILRDAIIEKFAHENAIEEFSCTTSAAILI